MFRTPTLVAALCAAAFAVPATAQLQVFGGDGPRMSSTRIFWDSGPAGMLCVQYGQPPWKAEHGAAIEKAKGQQLRLGKDFWTTYNASVPVTIGGTRVPAGSYYLGLKCDAEGGFHLMVLDARKSDKQGWTPFIADQWKTRLLCPMKRAKGDASVEKMRIAFDQPGEDPTKMLFTIAWGTHVLSAPAVAHLGEEEVVEHGGEHGVEHGGEHGGGHEGEHGVETVEVEVIRKKK